MNDLITPSNIMFAIGIIGIIFSIYKSYHVPQEELDKRTAVEKEEVDGKAKVLEQRVQWEKEANEKRFSDMSLRLTEAMTLAENHTHTVDVKVDNLIKIVGDLNGSIIRLETTINERIPRK